MRRLLFSLKMQIRLSDHFDFKKLIRFTLPSVSMMIFTSVYGVVDGYFVSNFVGDTEFAAVNFIMPFLMILGAIGFMFGTGGSALVSKLFGEKKDEKANSVFSMIIFSSIILALILSVVGIIFLGDIALFLGANEKMFDICLLYGRINLVALPFFILQYEFQAFMITAEKPTFGFIVTLSSGLANIIGDFLFVGVFGWGVTGAALATALSQFVGGIIPLIYSVLPNKSILRFRKFKFDFPALFKSCYNGISEFISNISMSIVSMLFNYQLMKYIGQNGVSAYGTFMYISFIFVSVFVGYSTGIAPVFSYNYGAKNGDELKNLFKKSISVIAALTVLMVVSGQLLSAPLSKLYVGYNEELFSLTKRAISISSLCFIFSGVGIFGSSLFTAMNNGTISALISFLRTGVFQSLSVIILPLLLGVDGIWISIVLADMLAAVITVIFIISNKKKYEY